MNEDDDMLGSFVLVFSFLAAAGFVLVGLPKILDRSLHWSRKDDRALLRFFGSESSVVECGLCGNEIQVPFGADESDTYLDHVKEELSNADGPT